jgi:hypothetical protein
LSNLLTAALSVGGGGATAQGQLLIHVISDATSAYLALFSLLLSSLLLEISELPKRLTSVVICASRHSFSQDDVCSDYHKGSSFLEGLCDTSKTNLIIA